MKKILNFMLNAAIRAFAVAGYSFFGLIVVTRDFKVCFLSSLIAGGSYFFTELIRYFKINPKNIKNKNFSFWLFP